MFKLQTIENWTIAISVIVCHIGIHTWIEKLINTVKIEKVKLIIIKSETSIDRSSWTLKKIN